MRDIISNPPARCEFMVFLPYSMSDYRSLGGGGKNISFITRGCPKTSFIDVCLSDLSFFSVTPPEASWLDVSDLSMGPSMMLTRGFPAPKMLPLPTSSWDDVGDLAHVCPKGWVGCTSSHPNHPSFTEMFGITGISWMCLPIAWAVKKHREQRRNRTRRRCQNVTRRSKALRHLRRAMFTTHMGNLGCKLKT